MDTVGPRFSQWIQSIQQPRPPSDPVPYWKQHAAADSMSYRSRCEGLIRAAAQRLRMKNYARLSELVQLIRQTGESTCIAKAEQDLANA